MTQHSFTQALLDPDLAVPDGLLDGQGRPAGRRFSVYRNNVANSLTEALEQGFPVLQKLLGEGFFKAMAGVFLRAHPPKSRLMMHYGTELPDFIAAFPPLKHLPYLADVARLELAMRASYHAADTAPLGADILGALSDDEFAAARFQLAPTVRLVSSDYPVLSIWRANMLAEAPPPAMQPEATLLVRPEYDVLPHLLPKGGAAFIAALQTGECVADALDAAGKGFDFSTVLGQLIGGGALTGFIEVPE